MKLSELLAALPPVEPPDSDPDIRSIVSDSRRVEPGALFVAFRGEKADGYAFAAQAAGRGAAAILSDRARPAGVDLPWARAAHPREAAARLASRLHGDPWKAMTLAGVTGTNGKTTTAVLLEGIFEKAFGASGYIGSIGYRWKRTFREAPRTTPEGEDLARMLAQMRDDGVPACAMEVSSHGLALDRVSGLRFDAAVFTNLTRDHLDFHETMENYAAAKEKLFALRKEAAPAVLNLDDPQGRRYLETVTPPTVSFSPSGDPRADVAARDLELSLEATRATIVTRQGSFRLESPLVGRFNVENLVAAWAAAAALGIAAPVLSEALATNRGAPGRLERVDAGQPFPIFVDFAHTEDALRRLLSAIRELTDRRLILVFGCGGDRDRGKREPMGRAAAELSDIPIATSDNPRGEDPGEILKEVERGLVRGGASKYLKFLDRREAIEAAMELANSRSVVVLAGKGHETVQEIGGRRVPFDDRLVAAEAARRARRSAPA
jgi:UDP-N-acetylmuramoyl-L-alanyl-D-glutamate--2,6-diaminopimelate ligase